MGGKRVLSGKLSYAEFPDLLQFVANNQSSGVLVLSHPLVGSPGQVFLFKGRIVDATLERLSGLDALYPLFSWKEGDFEFILQDVKQRPAINKGIMEIIMDGVRMVDEGSITAPDQVERQLCDLVLESEEADSFLVGPEVDYSYLVDESAYQEGAQVIEEGAYGNWICVVLEGRADIIKKTDKGEMTLCQIGPGAFVGNLNILLHRSNERTSSVKAVTDLVLGMIDLDRLLADFAVMPPTLRTVLLSLHKRLSVANRLLVEYHSGRNPLEEFLEGREKVFPMEKDFLGIIKKGSAALIHRNPSGHVPLTEIGQGEFLGELPVLKTGQEPVESVVVASSDMVTQPLDAAALEKQFTKSPLTIQNLITYHGARIAWSDQKICSVSEAVRNLGAAG